MKNYNVARFLRIFLLLFSIDGLISFSLGRSIFPIKQEHVLDQAISCAADIVYHQKGGKKGLKLAASTLSNVMEHLDNIKTMKKYVADCNEEKVNLPKADKLSPELYTGMINFDQYNTYPGIHALLYRFAEPKIYCSKKGAGAGFGVILGLGLNFDFSSCKDSFGFRWLATGLGVQFQTKLLGISGYEYQKTNDIQKYSKNFFYSSFSLEKEFSTAMFLNIVKDKNDKQIGNGIGINIGSSNNRGLQINIPLIPMTKDKKYLRDILLGANKDFDYRLGI